MNIKLDKKPVLEIDSDILVLGVFDEKKQKDETFKIVDSALEKTISKYIFSQEQFKPKFLNMYTLPTLNKIKTPKILLIGMGEEEKLNSDRIRQIAIEISKKIKAFKNVATAVISIPFDKSSEENIQALTEGFILGSYTFDKYKSEKVKDILKNIIIACPNNTKAIQTALNKGEIFAKYTNFARNLSNEPAQYATPSKLAEIALNIPNIDVEVFDKKECEKKGMGAFLAVGQGSDQPPKFIHMTYKPAQKPVKKIAIIGKGITFDSGGYDIKPPASMLNMKDDMSGAAAVLGIMSAICELQPDVEVHGIIAACENMLSGHSYKPGDILTAQNGKTIEVDNTDAEGRLTLADALCFAEKLKVDEIIDIATLTGACLVALGHYASGIMGNDDEMIKNIQSASNRAGEDFWALPIWDVHMESLKSDIADMKNTGSRYGGASVAGAFLKNFVASTKWVHLDVAGTAFLDTPYKGFPKGGTGIGVRTLLEYITR